MSRTGLRVGIITKVGAIIGMNHLLASNVFI